MCSNDSDWDPHSEGQNSFYWEKSQDEGLINPHIIKPRQTLFAAEVTFSRFLSTHRLTHPLAEEQSTNITSFGREVHDEESCNPKRHRACSRSQHDWELLNILWKRSLHLFLARIHTDALGLSAGVSRSFFPQQKGRMERDAFRNHCCRKEIKVGLCRERNCVRFFPTKSIMSMLMQESPGTF